MISQLLPNFKSQLAQKEGTVSYENNQRLEQCPGDTELRKDIFNQLFFNIGIRCIISCHITFIPRGYQIVHDSSTTLPKLTQYTHFFIFCYGGHVVFSVRYSVVGILQGG